MSSVLALTAPFFALIFLGMFCRAIGFMTASDSLTLSKFAFFVALPPMMFLNIAAGNPADLLNWGFVWRYELATILIFVGSAFAAKQAFSLSRLESGIFGLNVGYPNYGYMGIPLAIMAFGDAAALPMALLLFTDTIILLALTAAFVAGGGGGMLPALARTLKTMLKNPLLISVVAGVAFAASGLTLPMPVSTALDMLASAAPPVALFALGATVLGQPVNRAFSELGTISLAKLVLHPLLVAALFLLIPGQETLWIQVAILSASLPVAANVFVLSTHYGGYSGRTASAILVSTVIASVTVPFVLYLLFGMTGSG